MNILLYSLSTLQFKTMTEYKLQPWIKYNKYRNFADLIWNPHIGVGQYIKKYFDAHRDSIDIISTLCFHASCYSVVEFIETYLDNIPDKTELLVELCENPNPRVLPIIQKLEQHMNDYAWSALCKQEYAADYIITHPNKIHWENLCRNTSPSAIDYLSQRIEKINWRILSANPSAIPLLEKHMEKIDWASLSANTRAEHILRENPEKINWDIASANSGIIDLISENYDKINWVKLSENTGATSIIRENIEKCDPFYLTLNPSTTFYIKEHMSSIVHWNLIYSRNPGIFAE